MAYLIKLTNHDTYPIKFVNPYVAGDENIADPLKGKLWNTGDASARQAHAVDDCGVICGESYEKKGGEWIYKAEGALVDGEIGPKFEKKHIAALRLYKNNEYVYLMPGDAVEFYARSYAELAYYLGIQDSEILKFENRDKFMIPANENEGSGEGLGEE